MINKRNHVYTSAINHAHFGTLSIGHNIERFPPNTTPVYDSESLNCLVPKTKAESRTVKAFEQGEHKVHVM